MGEGKFILSEVSKDPLHLSPKCVLRPRRHNLFSKLSNLELNSAIISCILCSSLSTLNCDRGHGPELEWRRQETASSDARLTEMQIDFLSLSGREREEGARSSNPSYDSLGSRRGDEGGEGGGIRAAIKGDDDSHRMRALHRRHNYPRSGYPCYQVCPGPSTNPGQSTCDGTDYGGREWYHMRILGWEC